ncbi:MAG: hypothetical protein KAS12_03645 [Candidatus Aenigmarchaeota archaeon]|nr:hypothetical protein [Candidatus Aenigmarchaeota archaeon]
MTLVLKKKKWINKILEIPETGMGYQVVDIRLKSGTIIGKVFVYNCSVLEIPERYSQITENDIANITPGYL